MNGAALCDTVQAVQIDNFCNTPDSPCETDWSMRWYQVQCSATSDNLQKIGVARLFQKHHLNTLRSVSASIHCSNTADLHNFPIVVDADCYCGQPQAFFHQITTSHNNSIIRLFIGKSKL